MNLSDKIDLSSNIMEGGPTYASSQKAGDVQRQFSSAFQEGAIIIKNKVAEGSNEREIDPI